MKPRNHEYSSYDTKPALDRWFSSYHLDEEKPGELKGKILEEKTKEKETPEKVKKPEKDEARKDTGKDRPAETPEKEETKQEKRLEVVERSLALKKQFEEEPIPKDPEVLARLIVAEQVIALDDHLKDPDTTENKEELEETLDYLCLLAEKFENPEEESTPSVESAYEHLLELVQDSLEEDARPETILDRIDAMLQSQNQRDDKPLPDTPLSSPTLSASRPVSPAPKIGAISGLVQFVSYLRKSSSKTTAPSAPVHQTGSATPDQMPRPEQYAPTGGDQLPASSPSSHSYEKPRDDYRLTDRPLPRDAAEYHNTILPRSSLRPLAALALASAIAVKAVFPERKPSPETQPNTEPGTPTHKEIREKTHPAEETPPLAPVSSVEKAPLSPVHHTESEEAPRTEPPRHSAAPQSTSGEPKPHFSSHDAETIAAAFDRKIEHMPLLRLLSLAHGVPLGYGQYLKEEFEKGNIDKEGLIKVLKARAKGKDYSSEYRRQVIRYQQVRATPEFLRHDTAPISLPLAPSRQEEKPESPQVTTSPSATPPRTLPKPTPLPSPAQPASEPQEKEVPAQHNAPWIIAITIGLAILSVLVWTLVS